jgi:hypothetical protein
LKRLDEEIHRRVKITLNDSRKLCDSQKYKEAAGALEDAMKLQAFPASDRIDLALCYLRLGDRSNGLEFLRKATVGTSDPKQKQKPLQLITYFIIGENALSVNDSDKVRIVCASTGSPKALQWKPHLKILRATSRRLMKNAPLTNRLPSPRSSRQTRPPVFRAKSARVPGRAYAMRWAS